MNRNEKTLKNQDVDSTYRLSNREPNKTITLGDGLFLFGLIVFIMSIILALLRIMGIL